MHQQANSFYYLTTWITNMGATWQTVVLPDKLHATAYAAAHTHIQRTSMDSNPLLIYVQHRIANS
jgi:hypothetical protein